MSLDHPVENNADLHNLHRFIEAQSASYKDALAEIHAGRKRSHWMWYVFPQVAGLGLSATSQHFAIRSAVEGRAYLAHPILGPRLIECCQAVLANTERSAAQIFGSPDDLKLKSSATLFAALSPAGSVFEKLLDQFFASQRDNRTLHLLGLS